MERKLYDNLLEWKKNKIEMPYMLVGARQTGKTYILKEFYKKEFEKNIYINLDSMESISQIFENTIVPEKIISSIETLLNIDIDIEKTIKCNGIQTPKSPLKAYMEDNFKIYLSDIGLLRKLAKVSTQEIGSLSTNLRKNHPILHSLLLTIFFISFKKYMRTIYNFIKIFNISI